MGLGTISLGTLITLHFEGIQFGRVLGPPFGSVIAPLQQVPPEFGRPYYYNMVQTAFKGRPQALGTST